MKKVKTVYFFMNGNIACFDFNDNQIPELQQWSMITYSLWRSRAVDLGYDLSQMEHHIKECE